MNKEQPRDRTLKTDDEIQRYWQAIHDGDMCVEILDILKLSLMLGQRVGEMRQIERAHFDDQKQFLNIPSKTAKNKSHHI